MYISTSKKVLALHLLQTNLIMFRFPAYMHIFLYITSTVIYFNIYKPFNFSRVLIFCGTASYADMFLEHFSMVTLSLRYPVVSNFTYKNYIVVKFNLILCTFVARQAGV